MKKLNVAIMSSIFYPKGENKKREKIIRVLNILKYYTGCNFDLFLLDDGTNDEELDFAIQNFKESDFCNILTYKKRTDNRGISKSLNELLEMIPDNTYDYICTMDLDIYIPPNFLKKCIDVLKNDDNIAICGVQVEDYLQPDIENGLYRCKDSNVYYTLLYTGLNPNAIIGGACLVLKGNQFKSFRYDERLRFHHLDAYLIQYTLCNFGKIATILDKGYHTHDCESKNYIELKTKEHIETRDLAKQVFSQIPRIR